MITVAAWLNSVADLPRLECEVLLGHVLGLNRAAILARPDREIDDSALHEHVHALRSGTPLAYLLGEREFWGLALAVSPEVLIPRPETELLVELASRIAPPAAAVVDLGTGSGAIAIALAKERPDLQITATDISAAALQVAAHNVERHGVDVRFLQGAWLQAVPARSRFDLILSNPPYIAADDPHLPALRAEPQMALIADDNGLADLYAIIHSSTDHLRPGGQLLVEHGFDQAEPVRAAFAAEGFIEVRSERDLAGIERVCRGTLP